MIWVHEAKARVGRALFPERHKRWRRWRNHDTASDAVIDHAAWDDFLRKYLVSASDGVNRVRYGAVTGADRASLDRYVDHMAAQPIGTYKRNEQLAYWVNLYNALTVAVVLDAYPIKSIRNIGLLPSWLGGGPWDRKRICVEGEALSLNDIEHRILRRNWRDRRIHYGVNCAAVGCPNLLQSAFRGTTVDASLDDAERTFVNDPRGVRFENERLIVNSIYMWFATDFTAPGGTILDYLQSHAEPDLALRLSRHRAPDGHGYDWALNDAGP